MTYNIEFRNKVLKVLVKINEPYYSAIKKHIYELAEIQDRKDIRN